MGKNKRSEKKIARAYGKNEEGFADLPCKVSNKKIARLHAGYNWFGWANKLKAHYYFKRLWKYHRNTQYK